MSRSDKKRREVVPAKPTVSLQIRMDPELMTRFIAHVKARGVSRSEWIRLAVEEAVK